MRYHWGMGIGHKYAWDVEVEARLSNPVPASTVLAESSGSRAKDSEASLRSALAEMGDSMTVEVHDVSDEDEPQSGQDKNGLEDLRDGMEDHENEDLGDDSSDGGFD